VSYLSRKRLLSQNKFFKKMGPDQCFFLLLYNTDEIAWKMRVVRAGGLFQWCFISLTNKLLIT